MITAQFLRLMVKWKQKYRLTNREIADRVGTTEHTIGKILKGQQTNTGQEIMDALMREMHVKLQYIELDEDTTGREVISLPPSAEVAIRVGDTMITADPRAMLVSGEWGVIRTSRKTWIWGRVHTLDQYYLVVGVDGSHTQIHRDQVDWVAPVSQANIIQPKHGGEQPGHDADHGEDAGSL